MHTAESVRISSQRPSKQRKACIKNPVTINAVVFYLYEFLPLMNYRTITSQTVKFRRML